jgi:hypothetical protein
MSFRVLAAHFKTVESKKLFSTHVDLAHRIPLHIQERLREKMGAKSPYIKALLLHDSVMHDGLRGSLPIITTCEPTYVCPRPVRYLYMDKDNAITPEINDAIINKAIEDYECDSYFSYRTQPHLERLFTIHSNTHTIAAWDTTTGQLVHRWATSLEPYNVQVTDNRIASLLVQYRDHDTQKPMLDTHIGYGDLSDNGIFKRIEPFGCGDTISQFIFDTSGDYVICGSKNGALVVWDIDANSFLARLPHVNAPEITALASSKGLLLASGCKQGTIRIWNPLKNINRMLKGHARAIRSLHFNKSADLLLSSSQDRTVRLWSVVLAQCLHTIKTDDYPIMFEEYPFVYATLSKQDICSCHFADDDTAIEIDVIHTISFDGQHHGKTSYKHVFINKKMQKDLSNLSLEQLCALHHVGTHLLENTPIDFKDSNTVRDLYRKLPERLKAIIKKKVSWSDWMWMNYEDTKARLLPT